MAHKVSNLLSKVLGNIRRQQGLDVGILSNICSLKEREAINTIRTYKKKAYIYVKSNGVLYGLSLKKNKIFNCIKENTDEYITDVVFKIGEFNGS